MTFGKKHRKVEQTEPEGPPFPLDKPNSCEHCMHNLCMGLTYICDACYGTDKRIETWWWTKELNAFRTWDRCDNYDPHKVCATCKYGPAKDVITETRIIGDEEVKVRIDPSTKCPYRFECKHAEKWEPKGVSE